MEAKILVELVISTAVPVQTVPTVASLVLDPGMISCLVQPDHGKSDISDLVASQDGLCGQGVGETCLRAPFGPCCSGTGVCGSSRAHCDPTTCQSGFGTWYVALNPLYLDIS